MYKLYHKNPLYFAIAWIVVYCLLQSVANGLSETIGIQKSANALLASIQSAYLIYWLREYGFTSKVQLQKPTQSNQHMLYYIPLFIISTSNLWLGIHMNLSMNELICHVLLMLNVGFLEEVLFRGFLFEALRKDGLKSAMIITSLTFGIGHFINLFNGSGKSVMYVVLQIVFAILLGFLFVMIYIWSGSIIPCILSHQLINITSAFANYDAAQGANAIVNMIEILIIVGYITMMLRKNKVFL